MNTLTLILPIPLLIIVWGIPFLFQILLLLLSPFFREEPEAVGGLFFVNLFGLGLLMDLAILLAFIIDFFITVRHLNKKGGVHMPRIFRYAMYLALVILVWKVVNNIDVITKIALQIFFGKTI